MLDVLSKSGFSVSANAHFLEQRFSDRDGNKKIYRLTVRFLDTSLERPSNITSVYDTLDLCDFATIVGDYYLRAMPFRPRETLVEVLRCLYSRVGIARICNHYGLPLVTFVVTLSGGLQLGLFSGFPDDTEGASQDK